MSPVRVRRHEAREIAPALPAGALVSDVGSSKRAVTDALMAALPGHAVIPAHPVAGTENSGPDAGFAEVFRNRWCIVTPPPGADPARCSTLTAGSVPDRSRRRSAT